MSVPFSRRATAPAAVSLSLLVMSGLASPAVQADEAVPVAVAMAQPMGSIVITATRLPTPEADVASSVTVITAEDIEQKQQRDLADVLRDVPGLALVQTGGPGGVASVFMRGSNANHTKVLIDGIDMGDPSSASGAFDFSQVLTGDIERVEIVRGPQSGLYGSDAMGGVINIITKRGQGPAKGFASLEGGSFGTFNQAAGLNGSSGPFSYVVDLLHNRTEAVPVTPLGLVPPGEKRVDDLSDNRTLSSRFGMQLGGGVDLSLVTRLVDTELLNTGDHFDATRGAMEPDGSHSFNEGQQLFTRGALHQAAFDGAFDQTLGVAYSEYHRRYAAIDGVPNFYRGDRIKADWQGNVRVAPGETVTVGAETQRDGIDDDQVVYGMGDHASAHVSNSAGFAQLQSDWEQRVENTLSVRYDDNSRAGSKTTFRLAPAVLFPETGTKLKASVGSGFKAPSLDQLFDNYPAYSFYANPNLRPEKSLGVDGGFEQTVGAVKFGSTYFHTSFDDLITTVYGNFTGTYVNVAKATTQGFESFVAAAPMRSLSIRADHTYTLAEDDTSHQELLRRPRHKVSLSSTWQATDALSVVATLLYTGSWIDTDREGAIPRLRAGGYTTMNLAGTYALTERISLFSRVTNLFDRKVENPVGFQQPGIGAFGGVNVTF